jgi:segregation and condensation protein B
MLPLKCQVEAILYLKGQPLTLSELSELAEIDRDEIEVATIDLMADYAHRESALEVVETPSGYTLQLRGTMQELVDRLVPPEIGTGALRTLAAIAIKKTISQTDLVDLRGSGAYQHVQELVELGFVRKRRQAGNRSSLLQVTDKFYRTYEIDDTIAALIPKSIRSSAPETLPEPEEEETEVEMEVPEVVEPELEPELATRPNVLS